MLECINKECDSCRKDICYDSEVNNIGCCADRIKPTHTPTYAEEQLNHAIEKENNTPAAAPIDYEEEYRKLKKENEELKRGNENLKEILDNKDNYIIERERHISDLEGIIDSLKLKSAVTEKLEIEINNLNAIIDSKDDEINDLQISHNIIERENNNLKANINLISKCEENQKLKEIIKSLSDVL